MSPHERSMLSVLLTVCRKNDRAEACRIDAGYCLDAPEVMPAGSMLEVDFGRIYPGSISIQSTFKRGES